MSSDVNSPQDLFGDVSLVRPVPTKKLLTPDAVGTGVPTITVHAEIDGTSTATAVFALFLADEGDPTPATIPPEAVKLETPIGTNVVAGDVPILGTTQQVTRQALVIWPDNGGTPSRYVFHVVDEIDFRFQAPAEGPDPPPEPGPGQPPLGPPEAEVSLHGTIVVRVDQASARSGNVFYAKVFPGMVDVGSLGVPPREAVRLNESEIVTGVFENDVDVGEVAKDAVLEKTLAVWAQNGAVRTLPFRVKYPAASGGQHGPVNVYPKNAIWFAWAPPDREGEMEPITGPAEEVVNERVQGPGNPLWRYVYRPTRVVIPREATSVTIYAEAADTWQYDEDGNTVDADGTDASVSLDPMTNYRTSALGSEHIHETENDPNGSAVPKPIGSLVGIWGIHPEVDVFEIEIGRSESLTIPAAPRPLYLFLGMHKAARWQDAGDDSIAVTLQWT